jgi:S-ribosylhomocysteine lyase
VGIFMGSGGFVFYRAHVLAVKILAVFGVVYVRRCIHAPYKNGERYMKKIASFTVNHDVLQKGMYVSRIDGDVITYDIRMKIPNGGDYMDNLTMHSVEHMFATYVRASDIADRVMYFGPMGCQTGFYLLVRNADNNETLAVVKDVLSKIVNHDGEMFGAVKKECGNYKNLDLAAAKVEAKRYLDILNSKENDFKYLV